MILHCMSQQNVELVRLAVEAYQRRDAEALGEWLEHELDPWEAFRVEPIEIRAVGDRVLMRSRVTARGKGSSVELNAETGSVFSSSATARSSGCVPSSTGSGP